MTRDTCEECGFITKVGEMAGRLLCDDCQGLYLGHPACVICGAPVFDDVAHKHREDGFVVPLNDDTALVIRGHRVHWNAHTMRWETYDGIVVDADSYCFDLAEMIWGYRIGMSFGLVRKASHDVQVLCQGSSVRLWARGPKKAS